MKIDPIIDPNKTYTRATAPGESSVVVEGLVPDDVFEMIQALVDSDEFPEYKSIDDVIRDTVIHGLAMRRPTMSDQIEAEQLGDLLRSTAAVEEWLTEIEG